MDRAHLLRCGPFFRCKRNDINIRNNGGFVNRFPEKCSEKSKRPPMVHRKPFSGSLSLQDSFSNRWSMAAASARVALPLGSKVAPVRPVTTPAPTAQVMAAFA